jgi:hypothetical protein
MQYGQTLGHSRQCLLAPFRRIRQRWSHGLRQLLLHGLRMVHPMFLSRRRSR